MNYLFNKIITIALCSIFCLNTSCNKTAPIQNDCSKSSFRSDWENSYKNYTNSPKDVADSMPGDDGGAIDKTIDERIKYILKYKVLERYVDSVAHLSSTVMRIFNENIYFNLNFLSSKREYFIEGKQEHLYIEGKEVPFERKYFSDSSWTLKMDTAACFWIVKNTDNLLHIIYLTSAGTIKDVIVPLDEKLNTALQTVQQWKQSRQVSIPYEKKYGTIISYWDKGNSYHVFFPWMWNDDDCENGWQCTTQDTSVNKLHSAVLKFLCIAKQKGVLKQR